jgi:hypothetical protein
MANTTKDEEPKSKPVVSNKVFTEDDVKSMYNSGKNHYDIAQAVFGFTNEEALERVRQILGLDHTVQSELMDE